jgi:hypothetical protein
VFVGNIIIGTSLGRDTREAAGLADDGFYKKGGDEAGH